MVGTRVHARLGLAGRSAPPEPDWYLSPDRVSCKGSIPMTRTHGVLWCKPVVGVVILPSRVPRRGRIYPASGAMSANWQSLLVRRVASR